MAWKRPDKRRVRAIRDRLREMYGQPVNEPHGHPIAELIKTVLSQHTNDRNRDRAFAALRERFPSWEEVRDAPLESFSLDGEPYRWYARQAWEDLTGIDLLFVDGPPASTGHQARYPALPLLGPALSPDATVVLDDLVVPDMQQVLRRWLDAHPDFGAELLPLEKQAAVLRGTARLATLTATGGGAREPTDRSGYSLCSYRPSPARFTYSA